MQLNLRATAGSLPPLDFALQEAGTAPPSSSDIIQAEMWRDDGASGTGDFISGILLEPGQLTDADVAAGKPKVYLDGAPRPRHIAKLRGRHEDGSLKSVLLKMTESCLANGTRAVEIRLAETNDAGTLPYTRVTEAMVRPGGLRRIDATDPAHLCQTRVTGLPLVPDDDMLLAEREYWRTLRDAVMGELVGLGFPNSRGGAAEYSGPQAFIDAHCQSGNRAHVRNALAYTWARPVDNNVNGLAGGINYYTPSLGSNATLEAVVNPDGRTGGVNGDGGRPNEQYSLPAMSFAALYLLTGYRDFYSIVASCFQAGAKLQGSDVTSTYYVRTDAGVRFNVGKNGLAWMIAAHHIDATVPVADGNGAGAVIDFSLLATRWVDALLHHAWVKGDYRDGLVGIRDTVNDTPLVGGVPTGVAGQFPMFQFVVINNALIDLYTKVRADPRIPGMVKTNVDIVLKNCSMQTWGTYAHPYSLPAGSTPDTSGTTGDRYTFAEHAKSVAFCAKFYPSTVVNGATYEQWYVRMTRTTATLFPGLQWEWKLMGQYWGWGDPSTLWLRQQTAITGPSSVRAPVQYSSIPGNTPD